MSTINENESIESEEFFAFNDTDRPRVEEAINNFASASQGIDTTLIDPFRQGVELTTHKQVYNTTQPKIWAGNLKHRVKLTTYGQARDFTQYDNSPNFLEKPIFDPVWYIEDPTYPHPIIFNDGPMQEEEAIVEPFSIPFRIKNSAEGPYYPHSVRGSLEDGNNLDSLDGGTTRIEQFVEYNAPKTARFFLDEGQAYFGTQLPTGSLLTTKYNPVALYHFNGDILDKSGNGNNLHVGANDQPATVAYENGPFNGVQAFAFNGLTALTASVTASLQITGSVTIEAVLSLRDVAGGSTFPILAAIGGPAYSAVVGPGSLKDNWLATLGLSPFNSSGITTVGDPELFSYTQDESFAFHALTTTGSNVKRNKWMHVAMTRDTGHTTFFYVNGKLVGSGSQPGLPVADPSPSSFLTIGGAPNFFFAFSLTDLFGFSGSMSSVKIINRQLSSAEILDEAQFALPYESGFWNQLVQQSTIIPGFLPLIRRDVDPFDDTADEEIAGQLHTTNSSMISAVKALDLDLSEDIRETFNKKSATAGGDVYGPSAGRTGTDSISYRGMIKGC